jgi:hypothetical protein
MKKLLLAFCMGASLQAAPLTENDISDEDIRELIAIFKKADVKNVCWLIEDAYMHGDSMEQAVEKGMAWWKKECERRNS